MTPVVNGLASEYQGKVEFRSLDAASGAGERAFDAYALPGHPAFVLIDHDGIVLWRTAGPQSVDVLREVLEDALSSEPG